MIIQRNSDKRLPHKGERISHLACSLYLFDPSKESILLVKHKGLGVWLPPGGHVEEGELPQTAALRETFEETKIQDVILLDLKAGDLHLQAEEQKQLRFARKTEHEELFLEPFALIEEKILATDRDVEHFHVDYVYVGYLQYMQHTQILAMEVSDAQWVKLDEGVIEDLQTFPNIKVILRKMMAIKDHMVWEKTDQKR
jgi:8-oxo-dGTP pyrophosphatase MutT (NUDIX family)